MEKIKIFVSGAGGKMGREVLRAILNDQELELVGASDSKHSGEDVGQLLGLNSLDLLLTGALTTDGLKASGAQVLIDFTNPQSVLTNCKIALEAGVHPVIGTTGLSEEEIAEIHILAETLQIGAFIAPNFAIGAILMMKFAQEAARYFPNVEIIELHHDQKLDAPSGTGLKTAEMIADVRPVFTQGHANEYEKVPGARGADFQGLRIHSVRLPGLIAHQEVIFGGLGQALTIRHDAYSRETYMPGIVLAAKKVMNLKGLVVGLENLL